MPLERLSAQDVPCCTALSCYMTKDHLQAAHKTLVLIGKALRVCLLAFVNCSLQFAHVAHGPIQCLLSECHTQSLQGPSVPNHYLKHAIFSLHTNHSHPPSGSSICFGSVSRRPATASCTKQFAAASSPARRWEQSLTLCWAAFMPHKGRFVIRTCSRKS